MRENGMGESNVAHLYLFFTVTTIYNNLTFANKVQLNSYYYLC